MMSNYQQKKRPGATSGNLTGALFSIRHISRPGDLPALTKAGSIVTITQLIVILRGGVWKSIILCHLQSIIFEGIRSIFRKYLEGMDLFSLVNCSSRPSGDQERDRIGDL